MKTGTHTTHRRGSGCNRHQPMHHSGPSPVLDSAAHSENASFRWTLRPVHLLWIIGVLAAVFGLAGCTTGSLSSKSSLSPSSGSLQIAISAVPTAVLQAAYNTSVTVTGGEPPYAWDLTGPLPAGLEFNAQTGAITGTPASVGTFPITTTVRDAKADSVSHKFSLTVSPRRAPLAITSGALSAATEQAAYSEQLSADGGATPYAWGIASGVLPSGLVLNPSTGTIAGTPTAEGTFPFTVSVRDAKSELVSAGFAVVVAAKSSEPPSPTPTALKIETTSLPSGIAQQIYAAALNAAGGTAPYTWTTTSGKLPAGVKLISSGALSGTPTAAGTSSFTVSVRDANSASLSAKLAIVVGAKSSSNPTPTPAPTPTPTPAPTPAALHIVTSSLPVGTAQQNYSASFTATGGVSPYAWSTTTGQLPAGLKLSSSGAISGTPNSAGNATFTVTVKDSAKTIVSMGFSLNISAEPAPSISTLSPNSTSSTGVTTVVISGANFRPAATVHFGSIAATTVLLQSSTQIQVTVAFQSAGKVNVTVQNSDGQSATVNSAFTFKAPPPPPPAAPSAPSANLIPAQSSDSFVNSTGINLHLHDTGTPYTNFPAVQSALQSLGVRHVRDGLIDTTWTTYYNELNALGNAGIKAIFTTSTTQTASLLVSYPSRVANSFEGYEGPNEFDISGAPNWSSTLNSFMVTLHNAVKSSSQSSQFPILGPSLTQQASYPLIATSAPNFDYTNLHNYPGGRNPGTPGWSAGGYGSIAWNISIANSAWVNKSVITTETGYQTDVNQTNGVPEDVAGKYAPRIYLEQWLAGIQRTYIYELVDIGIPGGNNSYGLLHTDFSPKPSFTAVKNVLNLLADPGPAFTPTGLDFTLSGNLANVRHLLLEKRNGTFYLVLWVELPSYDVNAKTEISVPAQQVTVQTGAAMGTNIHQLDITGNMSNSSLGVAQSQTIQVSDLVTVLEISQ